MMMKKHLLHLSVAAMALLAAALPSRAQFHSNGEATVSAGDKWMEMNTEHFRIIFPDSYLQSAPACAHALEKAWKPVSQSIGIAPNELYKKKMPVVLHTRTAFSNGIVTWSPHRMELLTTPDAYGHTSLLNTDELAVHELRHVSQMQMGRFPGYKPFHVLFGEAFDGAMAGIYGGPALFEGDAVTTETALTKAGRGRTADFLEYYRASLPYGDFRSFRQWRWGSQRYYAPDYYRAGYVLIAGMRSVYGCDDFTKRYYDRIRGKFFPFFNLEKTVKEVSGKKLEEAFGEIEDSLVSAWKSNELERGSFMPSEALTSPLRMYSSMTGSVAWNGYLYCIRSGLDRSTELVRVGMDGRVERICAFASMTGKLAVSPIGQLVWSEYVQDTRRDLKSRSDIRYLDEYGRKRTLARGRYYNPAPSPDGGKIAVTRYPVEGGSDIVILDAFSGKVLDVIGNPRGIEITEPVWTGKGIFFSGVTREGSGIFRQDGSALTAPAPARIKQLRADGDDILFVCDRSGVNELHRVETAGGKVFQLTNSRLGGESHVFVGDTLYWSELSREGRTIRRTAVDALPVREVDICDVAAQPFAEDLSDGDASFGENDDFDDSYEVKPYRKAAHLLHFHSWAPVCVRLDAISSLSFDQLAQSVRPGATAFFQNELSTMSGYVSAGWPWCGRVNFTYSGWYPVIETNFDIGKTSTLSVNGYIPFNLSRGGVSRGIIPQISASVSNGRFEPQPDVPLNRISAKLRAYSMLPTAKSCMYPRWGIGAEIGYSFRAGLSDIIRPNCYQYVYGYLPGIIRTHGIKVSALHQEATGSGKYVETFASTAPRGAKSIETELCGHFTNHFLLSMDYAIPFAPVDFAMGPVAYLRNFELTLHLDNGFYNGNNDKKADILSLGATLCARLANLLWIPYDTRIGVSVFHNRGWNGLSPWTANFVFSVNL